MVKTLAAALTYVLLSTRSQKGAPRSTRRCARARCRRRRMRPRSHPPQDHEQQCSNEHLKVDRRGALLDVTLNRPKKLNALNLEMVRELQSGFDAAEASQGCVARAAR